MRLTKLALSVSFVLYLAFGAAGPRAQGAEQAVPSALPSPEVIPEGKELVTPRQPGFTPGEGYQIAQGSIGSLAISAYALLRYINQLPAEQTFTDHLGRVNQVKPRNDIELHRVLIHFKGFLFSPKFTQQTSVWAVNSTNSITAFAALNYAFDKAFVLSGGIGALPGTRSMNYEHPFLLGTDRQMADEFFRPSFTGGIWASGWPTDTLRYTVMIGNNLNQVDIKAAQVTRNMAVAGTVAWLPTTGEFGPREGYGDFEMHDRLATRFGFSYVHSRENAAVDASSNFPDNTQIKLSDSVFLFTPGSLAPGVSVFNTNYDTLALDAGMKHRGLFLFGEYYFRLLSRLDANGPLPMEAIFDQGFMLQASYMLKPELLEAYFAHSQLYGAFNRAYELTGGLNYYPFRSRSLRLNAVVTYVDRSPVQSYFGYFTGGEKGPIISLSTDYFF